MDQPSTTGAMGDIIVSIDPPKGPKEGSETNSRRTSMQKDKRESKQSNRRMSIHELEEQCDDEEEIVIGNPHPSHAVLEKSKQLQRIIFLIFQLSC